MLNVSRFPSNHSNLSIMPIIHIRHAALFSVMSSIFIGAAAQVVTGIEPEVQALLVSESEMQAQMVLKNKGNEPLLLHTSLYDVPQDKSLHLLTLTPVARIEAKSQQVVRFVLEKPPEALKVQHYKRVTFEGIPVKSPDTRGSKVRLSMRYDLPVIISPAGLKQVEAPWELIEWTVKERELTLFNPSPFVVRMSSFVDLLPGAQRIEIGQRTYVLPGEKVTISIPATQDPKTIEKVRLFPATLYGFAGADYDAPVKH